MIDKIKWEVIMKKFIKMTALFILIATAFSSITTYASVKYNKIEKSIGNAFYNSFTGTVKELTEGTEGSTVALVEDKNGSQANFIISKGTYIIDKIKIEIGTQITGFYEAGKPMIMIYPPQYNVEIIAPVIEGKNIKADKFDKDLLSYDKALKLNISEDTEIVWENGTAINWFKKPTAEELEKVLTNRKLIAFYDFTTKSLPAQTTPYKLIVLSQQEEALASEINFDNIIFNILSKLFNFNCGRFTVK